MPREARLFTSSAGSAVRGYLKFQANIPPRWIKNARGSRKRIEPEIAEGFCSLKRLRIRRPRAQVAIRNAQKELRVVLLLAIYPVLFSVFRIMHAALYQNRCKILKPEVAFPCC